VQLLSCPSCGFQLKHPPPDQGHLLSLYRSAAVDIEGEDTSLARRRFPLLASLVEKHAHGPRILDIGCSVGVWLAFLGDRWDRSGLEPSSAAADIARQRGVQILGGAVDDLDEDCPPFDLITAIDVVEHVVEPLAFFRRLSSYLAPGGVMLVSTGDTDAWTWRLLGSRYWYCSLPEHWSFFNLECLQTIARLNHLEVVDQRRFSHVRGPWSRTLLQASKNTAYLIGLRLRGLGIPALRRLFVERRAPGWHTARDHLAVVMRRRPES
jgi:SAM-dependent methyltransferase